MQDSKDLSFFKYASWHKLVNVLSLTANLSLQLSYNHKAIQRSACHDNDEVSNGPYKPKRRNNFSMSIGLDPSHMYVHFDPNSIELFLTESHLNNLHDFMIF